MMSMPTLSLRARLTVWYTLAVVVALCLFAGYVLYGQRRLGLARVDRGLDGLSATVANVIPAEPQAFGHATLTVAVASSLIDVRREQHEVLEAMEVAIPLVLLLAGGGGFWLASVGLRPIAEMAQRASRIPLTGSEDLGHTDRTDELGQFARAFNGLVARLRTVLRTQQQSMADASHELRTPISVVRAASAVTVSSPARA